MLCMTSSDTSPARSSATQRHGLQPVSGCSRTCAGSGGVAGGHGGDAIPPPAHLCRRQHHRQQPAAAAELAAGSRHHLHMPTAPSVTAGQRQCTTEEHQHQLMLGG